MEDIAPLPKELFQKCLHWVAAVHREAGFGNLPSRVVGSPNLSALFMLPAGRTMMGSARAAFQLRLINWSIVLPIIAVAYFRNRWFLIGLAAVAVVDRWLCAGEKRRWEFLAAALLALEILADDVFGWGGLFPNESLEAAQILGTREAGASMIAYYLPLRNQVIQRLLQPEGLSD